MKETIKEMPEELRPYERCEREGESSLSDAELLAVILRTGTRDKNSVELARHLLSVTRDTAFPGLPGLIHMSMADLMAVPGIGRVKAIQLKCAAELSRRMASAVAKSSLSFDEPDTIACYYMERLRHEEQEHLYLLMLDNRNHFMGEQLITRGTANATLVTPREVFIEALRMRALGIILVHNHPSGDPCPSECDFEITRRIGECGRLMGITLMDHVIIGDQTYFSFRDQGLLEEHAV